MEDSQEIHKTRRMYRCAELYRSTPPFHGSEGPDEYVEWEIGMYYASKHQFTEHELLRAAVSSFRDDARTWWKEIEYSRWPKEPITTWTKLRALMRRKYAPHLRLKSSTRSAHKPQDTSYRAKSSNLSVSKESVPYGYNENIAVVEPTRIKKREISQHVLVENIKRSLEKAFENFNSSMTHLSLPKVPLVDKGQKVQEANMEQNAEQANTKVVSKEEHKALEPIECGLVNQKEENQVYLSKPQTMLTPSHDNNSVISIPYLSVHDFSNTCVSNMSIAKDLEQVICTQDILQGSQSLVPDHDVEEIDIKHCILADNLEKEVSTENMMLSEQEQDDKPEYESFIFEVGADVELILMEKMPNKIDLPQTLKPRLRGNYLDSKNRMKPSLLSLDVGHTVLRDTLFKSEEYDDSRTNKSPGSIVEVVSQRENRVSCRENSFDVGALGGSYLLNPMEFHNEANCFGKLTLQSIHRKWNHHHDIPDLRVMKFSNWSYQNVQNLDTYVLQGGFRLNYKYLRDESSCSKISSHQGITSKQFEDNISSELKVMASPTQIIPSILNLRSRKMRILQSYIWRPGESPKISVTVLKYSFMYDCNDLCHLSLSSKSCKGARKAVKRRRRIFKREEDGRFKPPDLDQEKHKGVNQFHLIKEEPPDYNDDVYRLDRQDTDLRTNPFQLGEDDMSLDSSSSEEEEETPEGRVTRSKTRKKAPDPRMTRSRMAKRVQAFLDTSDMAPDRVTTVYNSFTQEEPGDLFD